MKDLILDALRDLRGRAGAIAMAMGGLTIALAACLLVGLFALALAAPDPDVTDPDRTVMLDFRSNPPGAASWWFGQAPLAFGLLLKARHAPLDLVSRMAYGGMEFDRDGRTHPALLLAVDPELVDVLNLHALAGDLRATLRGHDTIAITVDLLHQLWGELPPAQAVGRRVQSHGAWYTVTAVLPDTDPRSPMWAALPLIGRAMAMAAFDSPANTLSADQREDIFVPGYGQVFARLRPGTSVDQVAGWMHDAFVSSPRYPALPAAWRTNREAASFRGVTLRDLPFEGARHAQRWQAIAVIGAACALLLVLATFNTMNLQAAHLLRRQRETALRRSLGADHRHLLQLWTLEAALPLVLGALAALSIAWWVAPTLANWLELPPQLPVVDPIPLRALAGLALAVGALLVLTLVLPAGIALRRIPAAALQGRTASEGPWGRRVRQALLGLQLGGALLLLSVSGVLALQQAHLLHADRGFVTHGRLVLSMETDPDHIPILTAFTEALSRTAAVTHWTFSADPPAAGTQGQPEVQTSADGHAAYGRLSLVSPGFFDTYGMGLLAGSPRYAEGETDVVIDARTAHLLGFATPQAAIGAVLRGGGTFMQPGTELRRVVAVVRDASLESARDAVLPHSFLLSDKPMWNLTATGPDLEVLHEELDAAWRAHGLAVPYQLQWADDQLSDVYRQESQMTVAVAVISLLAVSVAMMGAWALVADTLRRRRTELVLHRLHGANDAAIVRRVLSEFGVPLLAATTVAWPLAGWIGWRYLQGFQDRIAPGPCIAAVLAAALVATLSVTLLAAFRHVRLALSLQPIEMLA